MHLLGDQPHRSLAKLAETHGPIMSLKLGQINTLVISSADAAKQVLQKQDLAFSTRHVPDASHAQNHAQFSVVWLRVCTEWRTLRRILNSNIFSNSSLETNQHLRIQKVEELIAYCRKASLSNDYVDIGHVAFRTSLNLLSNTIFSKDLADPYEDSGKEFKEVIGNIMVEAGKPNLVDFFPVLKKVDPQGIRRRMSIHMGKVLEIFDELIEERLQMGTLKHDDVLDVCLKMIQDNPDEITQAHIRSLLLDLFAAGTDTTSSTLEWAMTELLHHPHTMTKAKEELEEVLGKGRRICPGLPLAIRMIPMMLGSLLNNFDWKIDTKIQLDALDMTEKFGITLAKAKPLCVVPIPLN
ncbi:hypothetical protein E3N88_05078 [Mikania micrantha]|uniref:Geraniol 8-hydroxylase n=1 Tax=Mikania micrantha TaxID=192012 RepID=A0A5N6PZ04_9ASTR|nr:hypothetical protein E3N88_05078 [Mikania micrantha]